VETQFPKQARDQ
jgi:hypothetical protein